MKLISKYAASVLYLVCISLLAASLELTDNQQWLDNDNKKPEDDQQLIDQNQPEKRQFINGDESEAGLYVVNRHNGQLMNIYPSLFEETLLNKGSFDFGARLVRFDKLKVLGNVYVKNINGKSLRETYQLKSINPPENKQLVSNKRQLQPDAQSEAVKPTNEVEDNKMTFTVIDM